MDVKVFKVIIAGGRDFKNYNKLKNYCDKVLRSKIKEGYEIKIVSGTANGADKLGERYAKERGYEILRFPADWNAYGKRAGYIRNKQMAESADACVCFWDGTSRGTKWMIEIAEEKQLPLRVVRYEREIER